MGISSATSTFDLVERFREGDETAFSHLFARYKPRLAVLIRYKLSAPLRQHVEVDDILQEVFLAASRDIKNFSYRSPGSFMTWLSTFIAFSGVALFHEPYAKWLQSVAPWTRGQVEYLFILNAGFYLLFQSAFERFHFSQLRVAANSFRFVIPGHVMTSLLLLGLEASQLWEQSPGRAAMRREARTFEVLLPLVACAFVFGSIPKQMKNFFATGLFFLAIGIVRLQQDYFHNRAAWPIALLLAGVGLMLCASRYAPLRLALSRWLRRTP